MKNREDIERQSGVSRKRNRTSNDTRSDSIPQLALINSKSVHSEDANSFKKSDASPPSLPMLTNVVEGVNHVGMAVPPPPPQQQRSTKSVTRHAIPMKLSPYTVANTNAEARHVAVVSALTSTCTIDLSLLRSHLCCPICSQLLLDAVVLHCSHGFCQACIESFWARRKKDLGEQTFGSSRYRGHCHPVTALCPVCDEGPDSLEASQPHRTSDYSSSGDAMEGNRNRVS